MSTPPLRPLMVSAIALASIDAVTKLIPLVTPSHRVVRASNSGWMLGALSVAGSTATLASAGAVVLLVGWALKAYAQWSLPQWVAAAIIAGGVGNLVDRLVNGAVTDWLRFGRTAINVADLYLAVGIPWLVWATIHHTPRSKGSNHE